MHQCRPMNQYIDSGFTSPQMECLSMDGGKKSKVECAIYMASTTRHSRARPVPAPRPYVSPGITRAHGSQLTDHSPAPWTSQCPIQPQVSAPGFGPRGLRYTGSTAGKNGTMTESVSAVTEFDESVAAVTESVSAVTESLTASQRTPARDCNPETGIQRQKMGQDCPKCKKPFYQSSNLPKHGRIHTGQEPYDCRICKKSFLCSSSLKSHHLTHSGEQLFPCTGCDKSCFRTNNLKTHQGTHSGKTPYSCSKCRKTFSQLNSLRTHMRIHTGEKPCECDGCTQHFAASPRHKRHIKTHLRLKKFKCIVCAKSFSNMDSSKLAKHKKIHEEKERFSKPFDCGLCKKQFTKIETLKGHLKIHMKENKSKKSYYNKTLDKRDGHVKTHTGGNLFPCYNCNKKFNRVVVRPHHMETHAEDIFKCDDCAKSFDYQDSLKNHRRTHSFEPRLGCNQLEKKSNDQIYQMNQSDKMGLPKMINMNGSRLGCDKCGKRFQSRTSFVSHRPGHMNPNSCPSCQKLFNQTKNLWKHVSNRHSNKRCTVGDQTLEGSNPLTNTLETTMNPLQVRRQL